MKDGTTAIRNSSPAFIEKGDESFRKAEAELLTGINNRRTGIVTYVK